MIDHFDGQTEAESDFARLIKLQTDGGMNRLAQNGAGIILGDFFNFHAARGAGHEHDAAAGAVDEQAEIKFALDVEAFFDEHALHDAAGGAGLRRDELHAQDVAGDVGGLVGGARELDAAGFSAATGVDLRFHDANTRLQALRGFASFFLGESNFAARGSHTIARQNCLGLILMNLHRGSVIRSTLKQSASVRISRRCKT